jgi:hypothetical protein
VKLGILRLQETDEDTKKCVGTNVVPRGVFNKLLNLC